MFEVFNFSVSCKLSKIIGQDVCFGAEVVFWELTLHPDQVFPHKIFTTNLKRLREMIDLLVLRCVFEVLIPSNSGPHYIPLVSVGTHDTYTCNFESIDYRVVDVCSFCHFEA